MKQSHHNPRHDDGSQRRNGQPQDVDRESRFEEPTRNRPDARVTSRYGDDAYGDPIRRHDPYRDAASSRHDTQRNGPMYRDDHLDDIERQARFEPQRHGSGDAGRDPYGRVRGDDGPFADQRYAAYADDQRAGWGRGRRDAQDEAWMRPSTGERDEYENGPRVRRSEEPRYGEYTRGYGGVAYHRDIGGYEMGGYTSRDTIIERDSREAAGAGYGSSYRGGLGGGWAGGSDQGYGYPDRPMVAGRGPKGYTRSDDRIREDICERLMHEGRIDVGDVTVDVEKGTVKLGGHVEQRWMKHRIEDVADGCSGVMDVRNEIEVIRSGASRWRDDQPAASGRQDSAAAQTATSTINQPHGSVGTQRSDSGSGSGKGSGKN